MPTISYAKERSYATAQAGIGYVINISRKFNATLGGDAKVGMSFLRQIYRMADKNDSSHTGIERIIDSQDMSFIVLSPLVKLQYFITPRFTLNLDYTYGFQIQQKMSTSYLYGNNRVDGESGYFPELYDLHPGVDPEGNRHVTDFTGHRVRAGFGFYF